MSPLVVAAAVVLAACGGEGAGDGSAERAGAGSPTAVSPGQPVDAEAILAAVVDAGTVIGEPLDASALAGRPVVAWFWAPWCTICRAEGPSIAEIAAEYADQIVLVGVPGRGDIAEMERFIDDTGTGAITHVADLDGGVWSGFGVYGQPAFAFVTSDGDVDVFIGSLGKRGLTDRIEALVGTA